MYGIKTNWPECRGKDGYLGQKTIKVDNYTPETTLYYDYNTTVDAYHFRYKGSEDYGLGQEEFDVDTRMSDTEGEAMMEALIDHILAFKCSNEEERFIERYIKNNRFRSVKAEE